MKRTNFHNKRVGVMMGATLFLTATMSVGAAQPSDIAENTVLEAQDNHLEPAVSDGDGAGDELLKEVELPDTVGMLLDDARQLLAEYGEVIVTYHYSVEAEADVVMEQTWEAGTIHVTVSLGKEPVEDLYMVEAAPLHADKLGAFGISAYSSEAPIIIDGDFSDWDAFPAHYDYDWNNKNLLWGEGIWVPGVGNYKLPKGELDDVAENKFGFVVDDGYVYIHVKRATAGGPSFYFTDYQIIGNNGEYARFDIHDVSNGNLVLGQGNAASGIHEVSVVYVRTWGSMQPVEGAKAYLKVNDDLYNTELEMRIPLSALPEDWPDISWERADTLQFHNEQFMKSNMTASGASTAPFAMAVAALLGVPAAVTVIHKKGADKAGKEQNHE